MHGGDDAVGGRASGVQHAFSQKARAVQRDLVFQAGSRVVANELGRATARPEAGYCVGFQRGNLGQQCLELHLRKRQAQLFDDGATCSGVAFFESFKSFITSGVLPGDPHGFFVALVDHDLAQCACGLRVGK